MTPTLEHVAWLCCAVMGVLLAHLTLTVLETRGRLAIQRHDLIVRARRMRAEYLESVAARSGETAVAVDAIDEGEEIVDDVDESLTITSHPEPEPDTALRPAA